jgi:hypothetical protein
MQSIQRRSLSCAQKALIFLLWIKHEVIEAPTDFFILTTK